MNQLSRGGVVTLSEQTCDGWRERVKGLVSAVSEFHGGVQSYADIRPLASSAESKALQSFLFSTAPGLEEFAGLLKQKLRSSCALYLPRLGLAGYTVNERAILAYALAVGLGNPTATDKERVVWDVKYRARGDTYFSTFSETDSEAAHHTDTQYYPDPEPLFMLYCMQADRRGHGHSSVLDAKALRQDVEATQPWLAEILASTPLPFRVPSAFVTTDEPNVVEATLAPVFADVPFIRYRRDTLDSGLRYFPEYESDIVLRALDALKIEISRCKHQTDFLMPNDSLVLMDNHRALHARTAFRDHERHLLRIRMFDHDHRPSSAFPLIRRRVATTQEELTHV